MREKLVNGLNRKVNGAPKGCYGRSMDNGEQMVEGKMMPGSGLGQ